MRFKLLEWEEYPSTRLIYLNAPPVNGLNLELVEELEQAFSLVKQQTPEVRCLILASRLKDVFVAGADIKMIKRYIDGPDLVGDMIDFNTRLQATINVVEALPFPVIAAINGHALGGGLELALACDFRFMAKGNGRVGLPEVNLGILPGAGGTQRLSRLIGKSRSKDLIFHSRLLDAEAALSLGIVDQVFDSESLIDESLKYAKRFADRAGVAISVVKNCINQGLDGSLKAGLAIEMNGLDTLLKTEDLREGIRAFLEKRKPAFHGK